MELESNFDRYVVGTSNDRGYMQIIPSTEKWLADEFSIPYDPSKIFEPDYNIELAGAYLSLLKKSYGSNYSRILSEYNRGPYNLARYYEEYETYSTSYSKTVLNKEKKYLAFNY
jgi:soluble lytic murein transglycosylase-like protein